MSATWYNIYLPLWIQSKMTIAQLQTALSKGRITQEEYDKIVATSQDV
jgi:hypothetical protein